MLTALIPLPFQDDVSVANKLTAYKVILDHTKKRSKSCVYVIFRNPEQDEASMEAERIGKKYILHRELWAGESV